MKKYIIMLSLLLLLTSCFWNTQKEEKETKENVKKELLWENFWEENNEDNSWEEENNLDNEENNSWDLEESNSWDLENEVWEDEKIKQKYLTEEKYIELDDISIEDFDSMKAEITWKTLTSVDKIKVTFSNPSSNFETNPHTLKKFKAWDKKFLYRAFKEYEVIDYGENTYLIEAYAWDKVSKLELKVNLEKPKPASIDNLPEDEVIWKAIKSENGDVSYSKIDGLTLKNVWKLNLSMSTDSVTSYLKENISWWFYWNTLTYIKGKNWISFYVVRKDSESNVYSYYKYYYNSDSILGILKLKDWTIESSEELSKLNSKLKKENDSFSKTALADSLFKKLTN